VNITRVGADESGNTFFEELSVEMDPGDKWVNTTSFSSEEVLVRTYAPPKGDQDYHPHPAHARQLTIIVSGEKEIETSNGEVRRFSCGDVLVMDDLGSKGHITRTVSDDRVQLSILLPDTFTIDQWTLQRD
jgi:hypothetical protein